MTTPTANQEHVSPRRVAVVQWSGPDEMADALAAALSELGHQPILFDYTAAIPVADIVFSFAPFGNYMAVAERIAAMPLQEQPVLIHWNTEPMPDLRLPWHLVYPVSRVRSWIGRAACISKLGDKRPLSFVQSRMMRYRCVGDYFDTYRRGILNVLADCSAVYTALHLRHGLPTTYAPWGLVPTWYRDLELNRDIDVLWLGKRATRRRSQILDRVRDELRQHGVDVYVVDLVERPPVFGEERTQLLNRAKIVLNINRRWGDNSLFRFSLTAPNGALMVSEPMLPHCPEYWPGVHYVSAPIEQLSATILHYIRNENERRAIAENAYYLMQQKEMSLVYHVQRLVAEADTICWKRSMQRVGVVSRQVALRA